MDLGGIYTEQQKKRTIFPHHPIFMEIVPPLHVTYE